MKVMVVGGAGFIGSHLCDALLSVGEDVICVDNFSLGTRENISHLKGKKGFKVYEADASVWDMLNSIFEDEKPEYVYHLAANSDIQASASKPEIEFTNTYTTTFCILSCMREHGIKKLFFPLRRLFMETRGMSCLMRRRQDYLLFLIMVQLN